MMGYRFAQGGIVITTAAFLLPPRASLGKKTLVFIVSLKKTLVFIVSLKGESAGYARALSL